MRDSRHSRLVLVLLLAVSFALITIDIRGGRNSPVSHARDWASTIFGPAERATTAAVDPIANAIDAVKDAHSDQGENKRLRDENAKLRQEVAGVQYDRNRADDVDRMLHVAAEGQYTVKPARVVAMGPAQGFSWTVTIDVGQGDGVTPDMTVVNGDGLVGRVTSVGASTSTVLLATDPTFAVGSRMEGSMEIGIATGQGNRPMRMELLNGQAQVNKGDRLVTFGSQDSKPFVPGVPVGTVTSIVDTPGSLTKTVEVQPFVHFTSLDVVGVVVQPPRSDPRDAVLPPLPAPPSTPPPAAPASVPPSPTPTPSASSGAPRKPNGRN